jgi:hypothetical protein
MTRRGRKDTKETRSRGKKENTKHPKACYAVNKQRSKSTIRIRGFIKSEREANGIQGALRAEVTTRRAGAELLRH